MLRVGRVLGVVGGLGVVVLIGCAPTQTAAPTLSDGEFSPVVSAPPPAGASAVSAGAEPTSNLPPAEVTAEAGPAETVTEAPALATETVDLSSGGHKLVGDADPPPTVTETSKRSTPPPDGMSPGKAVSHPERATPTGADVLSGVASPAVADLPPDAASPTDPGSPTDTAASADPDAPTASATPEEPSAPSAASAVGADTPRAASMVGEPSVVAGALEEAVHRPAEAATPAAQPASAEPSPREQALAVARRLATAIVAPTDCGPPPLGAPSLLPNAARTYRSGIHQGIDYSCGEQGHQAVVALNGRVVVAAGDYRTASPARRNALLAIAAQRNSTPPFTLIALYGNYVVVDHGLIDGIGHVITIYAHLETVAADIRVGTQVRAGDPLGTIGNTGTRHDAAGDPDGGLHLRWEIPIDDRYLAEGLSTADTRGVYAALFENPENT